MRCRFLLMNFQDDEWNHCHCSKEQPLPPCFFIKTWFFFVGKLMIIIFSGSLGAELPWLEGHLRPRWCKNGAAIHRRGDERVPAARRRVLEPAARLRAAADERRGGGARSDPGEREELDNSHGRSHPERDPRKRAVHILEREDPPVACSPWKNSDGGGQLTGKCIKETAGTRCQPFLPN